jgi:hypothetical protein
MPAPEVLGDASARSEIAHPRATSTFERRPTIAADVLS